MLVVFILGCIVVAFGLAWAMDPGPHEPRQCGDQWRMVPRVSPKPPPPKVRYSVNCHAAWPDSPTRAPWSRDDSQGLAGSGKG